MTEKEKVVQKLEEVIAEAVYPDRPRKFMMPLELAEDALALLKAQEPHIVTIADYENNPNVDKDGNLAVWRESRHLNGIAYHNDGWAILNRDRVEGWFNNEMIRFWTSRPTDEQREAVKWE